MKKTQQAAVMLRYNDFGAPLRRQAKVEGWELVYLRSTERFLVVRQGQVAASFRNTAKGFSNALQWARLHDVAGDFRGSFDQASVRAWRRYSPELRN